MITYLDAKLPSQKQSLGHADLCCHHFLLAFISSGEINGLSVLFRIKLFVNYSRAIQ